MLYDVKGRFTLVKIKSKDEQNIKLVKVVKRTMGPNKVPYIVTHDARCIRYPNPDIKVFDTLKVDLKTGAIKDVMKLEIGKTYIALYFGFTK